MGHALYTHNVCVATGSRVKWATGVQSGIVLSPYCRQSAELLIKLELSVFFRLYPFNSGTVPTRSTAEEILWPKHTHVSYFTDCC